MALRPLSSSASTAPPPPTLAQQLMRWFDERYVVRLWSYTEPTWPPLARAADGSEPLGAIIQLKRSDRFRHENWRFVRERIDLTCLALLLEQLTGCTDSTDVLSHVARHDEVDAASYAQFAERTPFQLCVEYVVDAPMTLQQDTNELCHMFLDIYDHKRSFDHIYLAVRWELEQRLFAASPTWTRYLDQFPVQVKFALFPCHPLYSPGVNEREMEHAVQFVRVLNTPRDPPPAYRRASFPREGMQTHLPLKGFASIVLPRTLAVTTGFVRAAQDLQYVPVLKCDLKFFGLDPTKAECSDEDVVVLDRLLAKFQHQPYLAGDVGDLVPDHHR